MTTITLRFIKDALPYYGKITFNGTGWLFTFLYIDRAGQHVERGDNKLQGSWVAALQEAIEWAKQDFGFNDVLITHIDASEYTTH